MGYLVTKFPNAKSRGSSHVNRREGLIYILAVVLAGYLYLYRVPVSRSAHFGELGIGIVLCGLFPTFMYFTGRATPPIPLMPLVGLYYVLAFGMPVFYDPSRLVGRFQAISLDALLLTFTGLIAMLAAYYGVRRGVAKVISPIRIPRRYKESVLRQIVWLLISIHLAWRLVPQLFQLPSISHFTELAAYTAYGVLLLWWYDRKLTLGERVLLLGIVLPVELMSRLTVGSIAQVALLGVFLLLIVWLRTRRLPCKSIVAGLICFAILNEAKAEYRTKTWYSSDYENASLLIKTELFTDLAIKHMRRSESYGEEATDTLAGRISQMGFLSHVMALTPKFIPYWGGVSYLNLFYVAIPRILWPDKPVETLNYELSKRYGMRGIRDTTTSINVPWIVEMYANFGWAGTIIGMGFVGLLFAFLDARFNRPGMTPLESVFGATVCFSLCYQESNFSLMIGEKVLFYFLFSSLLRLSLVDRHLP